MRASRPEVGEGHDARVGEVADASVEAPVDLALALDRERRRRQVDHGRGVFVDPQDADARGQGLLEQSQAAFADVAAAGVVVATLGVVVVRQDHAVESHRGHEVESGRATRAPLPDL